MKKAPRIKGGHHDFTETDAAILRVLRRAKKPLKQREIVERGDIHRLHIDLRLQTLKHRGLIEVEGRTSGATWRIKR